MEKIKILIVEDEIFVARDLQLHLEQKGGMAASMVPSGEQALLEIENEVPNLVLMDIDLREELDGIETAEIIHTRFNIPVIFLTSHEDNATFERAIKTEPFGYVTKPLLGRGLLRAIEVALFRHKAEQDRKVLTQKWMVKLKSLEKQISKYTHLKEKYHKLIETAIDAVS